MFTSSSGADCHHTPPPCLPFRSPSTSQPLFSFFLFYLLSQAETSAYAEFYLLVLDTFLNSSVAVCKILCALTRDEQRVANADIYHYATLPWGIMCPLGKLLDVWFMLTCKC
ncbi:hypothetical protein CRV24_000465 [Beauveria bassiana]|nr:hypothetical protein CRV24_000465 [Beauveria bassiana]